MYLKSNCKNFREEMTPEDVPELPEEFEQSPSMIPEGPVLRDIPGIEIMSASDIPLPTVVHSHKDEDRIEDRPAYRRSPEQDGFMISAPVSRGAGVTESPRRGQYVLSAQEAEIAKVSGISPVEYVKQREIYKALKKANPDDYPSR